MNVYYINKLNNLPDLEANSCAIGNFDGIHIGHRSNNQRNHKKLLTTLIHYTYGTRSSHWTNPRITPIW